MRSKVTGLVLAALSVAAMAAPVQDQPVSDPIPERPITSELGLVLREFASFPKTTPTPAPTDARLMRHARINFIGEIPDGSGRMYVPDLNGPLYFVERGQPRVYLDVAATFAPRFFSGRGLGQGFGIVAFDPDFGRNGRFYTVHTEQASLAARPPDLTPHPNAAYHGVVEEWTAREPSAAVFEGTHRELLRIGFTGAVHGIQEIAFNPNARPGEAEYGLLYVAVGDGGRGTTVSNSDPQALEMPHGKILRIDPNGRDAANGRYGIPRTNPFAGGPSALGEIYAYGMRNPHRFSWDSGGQHRLLLSQIGEHGIESVYDVKPGDNLGWPHREGRFVFNKADRCRLYALPADDARHGYVYPVAAYDHDPPPDWKCVGDVGRAISGGYVYRGDALPELDGKYVFGEIVDGSVYYAVEREMRRGAPAAVHQMPIFDTSGSRVTLQQLAGDRRVDLHFGRDRRGDLYLLSKANGMIWKIVGTRRFASAPVGSTRVSGTDGAQNWAPVTRARWRFGSGQVVLAEAGEARPGPRRPFEYAVLTKGPAFSDVRIEADVRIDTPTDVSNRDVIIVFGHQSDTRFYYAHLSQDTTIYPHNGLFVVNDGDRVRIEDQWDAARSRGARPAISDTNWHHVRVVHVARTGEMAVYMDRSRDPLMTAVDKTFGYGRVGFGSFDNAGRVRNFTATGTRADR